MKLSQIILGFSSHDEYLSNLRRKQRYIGYLFQNKGKEVFFAVQFWGVGKRNWTASEMLIS